MTGDPPVPRFILFDIDGTLIDSAGAGRRALNQAMLDVTGIEDGFRGVHFAGKTDLLIVREGLEKLGLDPSDPMISLVAGRYVVNLRSEVARVGGHVKVGVRELIESLQNTDGCVLGLLTGNLEEGARIKLEPFGLNRFFSVGAYGSDAEDRNLLLPVALQRLREQRGMSLSSSDCLVIGDTPKDVECARVHGARSLAVATGPFPLEVLQKTGADLVVSDLSGTARLLAWIQRL
jgi:phosphoglycolate phosphatase-like HAD superfamily hydrolase